MKEIVLCGAHDSGKTTTINKIVEKLIGKGYKHSVEPYKHHVKDEGKIPDIVCLLEKNNKYILVISLGDKVGSIISDYVEADNKLNEKNLTIFSDNVHLIVAARSEGKTINCHLQKLKPKYKLEDIIPIAKYKSTNLEISDEECSEKYCDLIVGLIDLFEW